MAVWMYRKDCIEGKIFDTEEEAIKDGWSDSPVKASETPVEAPVEAPARRGRGRPRINDNS